MKIAIVGAGVAGASAVHHLPAGADVTVFEAGDRIGGRICSYTPPGRTEVEDLGAEYFVSGDWTMQQYIAQLGLEHQVEEYLSRRGILDQRQRLLRLPTDSDSRLGGLARKLGMIRYLGLTNVLSLTKLQQQVPHWAEELKEFYRILQQAPLDELFSEVSRMMDCYTDQTVMDFLQELGIKRPVIEQFIDPLIRPIYNLGVDRLNAFMGVMAFAMKTDKVLHLKGGNVQLVQPLEGIEVRMNCPVSAVTKTEDGYLVESAHGQELFQLVMVATPLAALRHIRFDNLTPVGKDIIEDMRQVPYNHVYHQVIRAMPREFLAELELDTVFVPQYTGNHVSEINIVSEGLYNITSDRPFEATNLEEFFSEVKLVRQIHFTNAYPLYTADTIQSIPRSNIVEHDRSSALYVGTDFLITSMGSSILLGQRTAQHMAEKLKLAKSEPSTVS